MERKYVKTFESFSGDFSTDLISHFDGIYGSEITNEGLVSWIKSKFKLTSLQKGFDNANKLIADNSKFKAELDSFMKKNEAKINAVNPEDVKKLTSLIKGQSNDVEKKIEVEAEKVSEADTEAKSFVEKIVSLLKNVLKFAAEAMWLLGSIASMILATTAEYGARYILSGEAQGNLSFSGTGMLMFAGGLIAIFGYVFYKTYSLYKKGLID